MYKDLKLLQFKARHQAYTLLSGHNLSKFHGEGYDFSELREYQLGDDIRKINWMISAKLGKPYIKEFHTHRELSVVVSALMDGSVYFGAGNTKQKKLTEVATLLGYATQQQGDLFSGFCYTQEKVHTTFPTKEPYHIEQFSKILYDTPLLGSSLNFNTAIQDLFKKLHKPSLLFIISDFLEEVNLSLLAQKHEVVAIIIRDKLEESPKKLGEVTLCSPCNNEEMVTYFSKKNVEKYLTLLNKQDAKLREHFSQYNIRYVKIFTDDDVISKLIPLFK